MGSLILPLHTQHTTTDSILSFLLALASPFPQQMLGLVFPSQKKKRKKRKKRKEELERRK